MIAGSYWLCETSKPSLWGWECSAAPLFSAPLVSHSVFLLLSVHPIAIINWFSLSALAKLSTQFFWVMRSKRHSMLCNCLQHCISVPCVFWKPVQSGTMGVRSPDVLTTTASWRLLLSKVCREKRSSFSCQCWGRVYCSSKWGLRCNDAGFASIWYMIYWHTIFRLCTSRVSLAVHDESK